MSALSALGTTASRGCRAGRGCPGSIGIGRRREGCWRAMDGMGRTVADAILHVSNNRLAGGGSAAGGGAGGAVIAHAGGRARPEGSEGTESSACQCPKKFGGYAAPAMALAGRLSRRAMMADGMRGRWHGCGPVGQPFRQAQDKSFLARAGGAGFGAFSKLSP